ncbi:unnamed protein product [Paramecium sonneborni]|uniref:Transcription termination factor 3, mitochondrial n=1 Tax=Paramecium sonneborni TaxID=65129 RepID=A0A8S1L485_9CILI|nr:unnamed protein product [Paramecium sonneborni]
MRATIFRFSTYAKFTEKLQNTKFATIYNYETQVKPALNIYESMGFNEQMIFRIFKNRGLSLVKGNTQNDIEQLNELFKTRLNADAKQMRTILFKDPQILSHPIDKMKNYIDLFEKQLQINKEDILSILTTYPLLMRNFEINYEKFRNVFNTYAHVSDKQFGQVLVNTPFLFSFNLDRIPPNFRIMYNREYKTQEIQEVIQKTAEFLALKNHDLDRLLNHYDVLIPNKEVQHQLLINNHKLLLLTPAYMLSPKINLFKEIGLSLNQIGQILQISPNLFAKSVQTLKLKLKFFEKHMNVKIKNSPFFPQILEFDYWTILRPRLVILNTLENAIDNLNMSQEEFIKKYDCEQKYQELLSEAPTKKKIDADFMIRNYHRYCHDRIQLLN